MMKDQCWLVKVVELRRPSALDPRLQLCCGMIFVVSILLYSIPELALNLNFPIHCQDDHCKDPITGL